VRSAQTQGAPVAKSIETYQREAARVPLYGVKIDDELVEKLLDKHHGIISYVADEIGCSRSSLESKIKKDPHLSACLKSSRERLLDRVEASYFERAIKGDSYNGTFILKTLGKSRGYSEKVQEENDLLKNVLQFVMDKTKSPAHTLATGHETKALPHTN
jgi:hypothetical protein